MSSAWFLSQTVVCNDGDRVTTGLQNLSLHSEAVTVDVSELSHEESKEAEQQHGQGPLTHGSSRAMAGVGQDKHYGNQSRNIKMKGLNAMTFLVHRMDTSNEQDGAEEAADDPGGSHPVPVV